MKLLAILILIATCLVVATAAQQTTLKPSTPKSTTSKTTTSKTTTPSAKVTTVKSTSKPIVTTTTLKPTTTKTTTLKPTTKKTTLKSTTTKATLKPTTKTTTLKPTTTKTTTLKPTTTKTTLKPTNKTTLKPTTTKTTIKPIVTTTTLKTPVTSTTLNPSTMSQFFLCRDTYSTALSGMIQPDRNSTNNNCIFDIVAPSNQQIQIFCYSLNFIIATSNNLDIDGDLDTSEQLVPNRTYYSVNNTLKLKYFKFLNEDSFYCNWTTAPKEITNQPKLCRHAESTAANGTVQFLAGDVDGPERHCSFLIKALPDQQIQISCSNIKSYSNNGFLSIEGTLEERGGFIMYGYKISPVLNRIYYSSGNNLTINAEFDYQDSIMCNWKTIPKEITTNNKLCRHSQSSLSISGTIQPLSGDGGPRRTCYFPISVLPSQRIQISCSDLNLNPDGDLNFEGITETWLEVFEPILNRMYYSADNNAYITSRFANKGSSFMCNWTAIPKENTTDFQFCRHGLASMTNGTIQPFSEIETGEIRECQFIISAIPNYKIQISCSNLNLTTQLSGAHTYLSIEGIADENVYEAPVSNRIYYSNADNRVVLTAKVSNTDQFRCNWQITPRGITVNNKLCRDTVSTTANGTIRPLIIGAAEPPRQCTFGISSRSDEQIQISCSYVGAGSLLTFEGAIDDADPPEVNRIYTSKNDFNEIRISSQVSVNSSQTWFDCKWAIAPRENITNNKLCLNSEAATPNGTLQPNAGDKGSPRQCDFSISSLPNEKIQISCSVVNLTNPNSYFSMDGTVIVDYLPVVNRVYYSSSSYIWISSQLGGGDWIDCKWTTTPRKSTAQSQLCNEYRATSANGTIQSTKGDTGPPRMCAFLISALSDKQIQISCSIVNLKSASSYLRISGLVDSYDSIRPVVNQVYYSTADNDIKLSSYLGYGDEMNCQWITMPKETMKPNKLCRHTEATTPNGTIQPIARNNTGPSKNCFFTIRAPYEHQIQISCPVVNLTDLTSYFEISITLDLNEYPTRPVANRVYASSYNIIYIDSLLGNRDWISCNWTTILPRENMTKFQFCLNARTTLARGSIQPLVGDVGPRRSCPFTITAPYDHQIQISCPAVNFTNPTDPTISSLEISGVIDKYDISVRPNRVYYSTSSNDVTLTAYNFGKTDWFSCNWTTVSIENKTDNQLCYQSESTTANGTLQPPSLILDTPRSCSFSIKGPIDQLIQFSCSVIKLTSFDSYFTINGVVDSVFGSVSPVVNRVYYSKYSVANDPWANTLNRIGINSLLGKEDWINCNWTTVPKEITTNYKICHHESTTSTRGTIQTIGGDPGPSRNCIFYLYIYSSLQISCSVVNITSPGSYINIISYNGGPSDYSPEVNTVYTYPYRPHGYIELTSQIEDGDSFNCNWEPTA